MSLAPDIVAGLPRNVQERLKERRGIDARIKRLKNTDLRGLGLPHFKKRVLAALEHQRDEPRPVLPLVKVPRLLKDLNFGRIFNMHQLNAAMIRQGEEPDHPDNKFIMMKHLYETRGVMPTEDEVFDALQKEYKKAGQK